MGSGWFPQTWQRLVFNEVQIPPFILGQEMCPWEFLGLWISEDFREEEWNDSDNFKEERQLWKKCCYKPVPVAQWVFDEVDLMR